MKQCIYECCDASHMAPYSETETCFFCGELVEARNPPVGIPGITPADLNPNEVSLYPDGGMGYLAYVYGAPEIS